MLGAETQGTGFGAGDRCRRHGAPRRRLERETRLAEGARLKTAPSSVEVDANLPTQTAAAKLSPQRRSGEVTTPRSSPAPDHQRYLWSMIFYALRCAWNSDFRFARTCRRLVTPERIAHALVFFAYLILSMMPFVALWLSAPLTNTEQDEGPWPRLLVSTTMLVFFFNVMSLTVRAGNHGADRRLSVGAGLGMLTMLIGVIIAEKTVLDTERGLALDSLRRVSSRSCGVRLTRPPIWYSTTSTLVQSWRR